MIRVVCPQCRKLMQCPDDWQGRVVACPGCKQQLLLPGAAPPAPPPAAAPPAPAEDNPWAEIDDRKPAPAPAPSPAPAAPASNPAVAGGSPFALLSDEPSPEGADEGELPRSARFVLPTNLPPEVATLGVPLAEFRVRFPFYAVLGLGLLLSFCSCGFIGGFVQLLLPTPTTSAAGGSPPPGGVKPKLGPAATVIALGIQGVVTAGLVGALVLVVRSAGRRRVLGFQEGLVCLNGSRATVYRFDDVDYYQSMTRIYVNGQYRGTRYRLTLVRGNGDRVTFNNDYNGIERLRSFLERKASQFGLERARQEWQRNGTATFEPFHLSRDGIHLRKAEVHWRDITHFEVVKGRLTIRSRFARGNWISMDVSEIANFRAFMEAVGAISSVGRL